MDIDESVIKRMTQAQAERQSRHWRNKGRYAQMSKCEFCGKPVGSKYYSLPDCNETGVGVCLCKACAKEARRKGKK